MEAKCNFCDFFNEKKHCHNCKVINGARAYAPKEINCSIDKLIEYININENVGDKLCVGDYKDILLYTGEPVRLVLIGTDADRLANGGGNAKTTFGIFDFDGYYKMNNDLTNTTGWNQSIMRNIYMERIIRLFPAALRMNIKPVIKRTCNNDGTIAESVDKCFLFSKSEIKSTPMEQSEGEQYEFFCYKENTCFNSDKLLRSPQCGNVYNFWSISNRGSFSYQTASTPMEIVFGFCI